MLIFSFNCSILYASMSTKNLSISCLLGNIFWIKTYNARIKNSSGSPCAVSLNCTETNNRLMLKHCSKNDKTALNYQQPHTFFITVIYLKIMKRNRYLMEWNGKPCYANKIAPKSFVIRVIRTVLINRLHLHA